MALHHITPTGPAVEDINAAHAYAAAARTACTKLSENPFCHHARVEMLRLIVKDSAEADLAWARLIAEHDAAP